MFTINETSKTGCDDKVNTNYIIEEGTNSFYDNLLENCQIL